MTFWGHSDDDTGLSTTGVCFGPDTSVCTGFCTGFCTEFCGFCPWAGMASPATFWAENVRRAQNAAKRVRESCILRGVVVLEYR